MDRKIKIIIIIVFIVAILLLVSHDNKNSVNADHWENDVGSVDKIIYGNPNSPTEMVLVAGIHPREPLSIEPEIKSAEQFASNHDVKLTVYHVNVTKNASDYELSRAHGESLVHDFIVPDIEKSDAKAVIISHSHIEGYGEGFYLATPAMDNASVTIAKKIADESDFKFFPRNTSKPVEASSAKLISIPLAEAGYPTFVYEIPENITEQDSTDKAIELFGLMYDILK